MTFSVNAKIERSPRSRCILQTQCKLTVSIVPRLSSCTYSEQIFARPIRNPSEILVRVNADCWWSILFVVCLNPQKVFSIAKANQTKTTCMVLKLCTSKNAEKAKSCEAHLDEELKAWNFSEKCLWQAWLFISSSLSHNTQMRDAVETVELFRSVILVSQTQSLRQDKFLRCSLIFYKLFSIKTRTRNLIKDESCCYCVSTLWCSLSELSRCLLHWKEYSRVGFPCSAAENATERGSFPHTKRQDLWARVGRSGFNKTSCSVPGSLEQTVHCSSWAQVHQPCSANDQDHWRLKETSARGLDDTFFSSCCPVLINGRFLQQCNLHGSVCSSVYSLVLSTEQFQLFTAARSVVTCSNSDWSSSEGVLFVNSFVRALSTGLTWPLCLNEPDRGIDCCREWSLCVWAGEPGPDYLELLRQC